jgi:hypothetical protein
MKKIQFDDGVGIVLDSILSDRLAVLAGAGLSMAPPSSLPSAAHIAAEAKKKYDATYGSTRPALAVSVDEKADFFFQKGELASTYFKRLIDKDAFAGPPNGGHSAIADFLLTRGLQTAVTTNVDGMIETAGQLLLGQIGVGIDGLSVAGLAPDVSPLLKIHGCRTSDPSNMVWAHGQVLASPVKERLASSAGWLAQRLLDRDLLVVGYWTDWDYLNEVLEKSLGAVSPARVIVVDPTDTATFGAKAPTLYALSQKAKLDHGHVQASGAEFLSAVRKEFSRTYIRRALHAGAGEYTSWSGSVPDPAWLEPTVTDNEVLWRIRRDLEGCAPQEPAKTREPADEPMVGLTILQLRAAGALEEGSYWTLNGYRIRVIRTPNRSLHSVQARFARELAPPVAPDLVIAVGADSSALPCNIARGAGSGTITRGAGLKWMTRIEGLQELGIV